MHWLLVVETWLVSEEIFAGTAWASSKADPLLLIGIFVYLFTCWMNTSSIWNQKLQQNEVFAILRQQVPWYNINIDTYLMSSTELGTFIKSFISNKNAKDMGTTRSVLSMKFWVQRIQRHAAWGHTSGWRCQDLHLTDQHQSLLCTHSVLRAHSVAPCLSHHELLAITGIQPHPRSIDLLNKCPSCFVCSSVCKHSTEPQDSGNQDRVFIPLLP